MAAGLDHLLSDGFGVRVLSEPGTTEAQRSFDPAADILALDRHKTPETHSFRFATRSARAASPRSRAPEPGGKLPFSIRT